MITKKVTDAINKQINEELYSSYLYLALASHYEAANLNGFAGWLKQQAQEEVGHAMKFYQFLHDRDGEVELQEIARPPKDFPDVHEAFSLAYEHEQKITTLIHELVDLAVQEKDVSFQQFLQWFVQEQVEEEASTKEIVDKLALAKGNPAGLMVLDEQLGKRGAESAA